jgi:hypothetical protein
MGAANRRNTQQDKHARSCQRSGKMAVVTRCGCCDRPVVGVIVRERPGQYCIECKGCGYSATSHYDQSKS